MSPSAPDACPFRFASAAAAWLFVLLLAGCRATAPDVVPTAPEDACPAPCPTAQSEPVPDPLAEARREFARAQSRRGVRAGTGALLRCAAKAHQAMDDEDGARRNEAALLATRCTDAFLGRALSQRRTWHDGPQSMAGTSLVVERRSLSPYLGEALDLVRAATVSMDMYQGERHRRPGFGVPLVVQSPRCNHAPLCDLLPPEGVFRWATAWVEHAPDGEPPRLVIADPVRTGPLVVGGQSYPLALDTSAFYAHGAGTSRLRRLAIWGLLGGKQIGQRAGLYLLEDYDPHKRPLLMVHGLASSPLTWARLSNAVWGDPVLRDRYQVWHLVYQTDAPLLVTRRRLQDYLDAAWAILDPDGTDPAREGMVLVGHSLGGVLSRLLLADSGEVLWDAAFSVPLDALRGRPEDLQLLQRIFRFQPYPGIDRAIFIAAPHDGSPTAERFVGRLVHALVGRRAPEMHALRRIANDNPEAVHETLRESYLQARLNSISTLRTAQPVRQAAASLLPQAGIPYHTIAGALPGRMPETDGVVPLRSALLPGAASTLVVPSGHDVHEHPDAVAEVLRILREQP